MEQKPNDNILLDKMAIAFQQATFMTMTLVDVKRGLLAAMSVYINDKVLTEIAEDIAS